MPPPQAVMSAANALNSPKPPPATIATLPAPNVPDYSKMSPELQAQHRANFVTRFGILREAWPHYNIPNIPETMALEEIHAQYDIYVRHIRINQDVDQYKVYMVIMWLIIELTCTKIGLNAGGYTISQMSSMSKYERLLIELGETKYQETGGVGTGQNSWSPEVRLLFMSMVNALTFIIVKTLSSYIGEGIANSIVDALSSYLSGSPPQPGQTLFGGPTDNAMAAGAAQPSVQPMPDMSNPLGGLDIASLIGNLGSMFIGRGGNTSSAPAANPDPIPTGGAQTPRFRPAYNE